MRLINNLTTIALSLGLSLGIGGTLWADRFAPDPVEELRQALDTGPLAALAAKADKVEGAGNLVRALLLRDWGLDPRQMEAWNTLVDRFFKAEAPRAFKMGDPALAIALSVKLVDLADTIPKNLIPRTTILEARLAALFPEVAPLAQSPDSGARAAVVKLVGRLRARPEAVLPWMDKLLGSPDVTTRRAVAEALGTMIDLAYGDVSKPPYSERELGEDPELLTASISLIPDPNVISRLTALAGQTLKDPDAEVRRLGLVALEKSTLPISEVGGEPSPFVLSDKVDKDFPPPVVARLKEFDKKYQAFYEGALEERNTQLPRALGTQAGPVGAALLDADTEVKLEARRTVESFARALRKTQRAPELPPFRKDERPKTQIPGGQKTVLLVALQAPPQDPLLEGVQRMLPDVARALSDPKPELRIRAAENLVSLGKFGLTPATAEALNRALCDPNLFVRWVSARALGEMADELVDAKDKDTDTQLALVVAAVPQLIKVLGERDLDVRMAVAETLGLIGPPARQAVPALTQAVNRGDAEIREKAILALQGIGQDSVSAIPALIDVLGQEGYFQLGGGRGAGTKVRRAAAELLGKFGKDATAAIPALRKALRDTDVDTREAAADALLRITAP